MGRFRDVGTERERGEDESSKGREETQPCQMRTPDHESAFHLAPTSPLLPARETTRVKNAHKQRDARNINEGALLN